MERYDLPDLQAGDERFEWIGAVLNEHGSIGIGEGTGRSRMGRQLYIIVEHADPQVTEWLWETTGLGRTSKRHVFGLLLTRDQRLLREVFQWKLCRYGEVRILLRRVWPFLSGRLQAEAKQTIRSMEEYRAKRKVGKNGKPLGRPEIISPRALAMQPKVTTRVPTGLWFIDKEVTRAELEGRPDGGTEE